MSIPCDTYQRYLEQGFTPFDPLELARQTEEIVCVAIVASTRNSTAQVCMEELRPAIPVAAALIPTLTGGEFPLN